METRPQAVAHIKKQSMPLSAYGLIIKNGVEDCSPMKQRKNKRSKRGDSSDEQAKPNKRKRHLLNEVEAEEEPIELLSGLSSQREKAKNDTDGFSAERKAEKCVKNFGRKSKKSVKSNLYVPSSEPPNDFGVTLDCEEERRRKERQARFSSSTSEPQTTLDSVFSALSTPRHKVTATNKKKGKSKVGLNNNDASQKAFVGTSQNLEKPYLRLTTFPKAEDVRPLPVLKRAFEHIKKKYRETEDFLWANEQLKSLRQDLTVQGLKNEFVLEVYEVHGRLSLEEGDLNEFNQCQTMIKSLTMGMSETKADANDIGSAQSCQGSLKLLKQSKDAADEFAAYRLLYALVQKEAGEVNKELSHANAVMAKEQKQAKEEKELCECMSSCKHAILVTRAIIQCDYHSFFILYDNAPNMSAYLMDFLVQRVRSSAYERIISAYRPTLSVEFFRETLFFHDLEETRIFLKKNGARFVREKGGGGPPFWIDCKASRQ